MAQTPEQVKKEMLDIIKRPFRGNGLTMPQEEAATLASYGLKYKQIAKKIGISEEAVKQRLASANKVLGTKTRDLAPKLIQKLVKYCEN